MLTVAVIGPGEWGKKIISNLKNVCFIKYIVFSGNPKTKKWCEQNASESECVTKLKAVLSDKNTTHVFISSPISSHSTIAKACLDSGKNVFVEKPLSANLHEINLLHELAQQHGLQLTTGYIYLYDASLVLLRKILTKEKEIKIKTSWEKYGSFKESIIDNLLVHELAIAHFLLGDYKNIVAGEIKSNDLIIDIRFERGVANINIDRTRNEKRKKITATFAGGGYELDSGRLILQDKNQQIFVSDQRLLDIEIESFINNKTHFNIKSTDQTVAKILTDISKQFTLNQ